VQVEIKKLLLLLAAKVDVDEVKRALTDFEQQIVT
jgi:hypothetical protein